MNLAFKNQKRNEKLLYIGILGWLTFSNTQI
jgi:hypothetical protein